MAVKLSKGLHYLHTRKPPYIHSDLKSLNILVTSDKNIKISNFGQHIETLESSPKLGTLNWLAPEVLGNDEENVYTLEADIYSFGVVVWEIITSNVPYEGKAPLQVMRMIQMGELLKIPNNVHPSIEHILLMCWDTNPKNRLNSKQAMEYLHQISKEKKEI